MPELIQESSSRSALIPSIHPDDWETFAVFRESFMVYLTPQGLNTAMRLAAESFFSLLLEHSSDDGRPELEESSTRTELRAAVADLRHSVGFLASIGKERKVSFPLAERSQAVQVRRRHEPAC
jgi:hypothetical protein